MKLIKLPAKEALDRLVRYMPKTGEFFWRVRPVTMFGVSKISDAAKPHSSDHACNQWNSRWAGKPAATLKAGYWYLTINYQKYLAHRIAWKIMTGADPVEIDHIDGNPGNNKWANLKDGTRSDNLRNVRLKSTNTSGHHGVWFSTRQQKWIASICIGSFDSKDEAVAARKKVEVFLGFHPNHGR